MGQQFSAAQLAALSHPHAAEAPPDPACIWHAPTEDQSEVLTCDIDDRTVAVFGGPVWHASVCPPVRAHAEALLAGVGEGVLFDEPGARLDIYHLRRRMTPAEIQRLGGAAR